MLKYPIPFFHWGNGISALPILPNVPICIKKKYFNSKKQPKQAINNDWNCLYIYDNETQSNIAYFKAAKYPYSPTILALMFNENEVGIEGV